jgi:hypothetical protein
MPHPTPLTSGDPTRVAGYQLTGRLAGIPSDDPIFLGAGPDGTQVAISVLSGQWARDAAARDRFAAEAAVAKNVPPFCAARVLDAGLDGATAYLVSEYIAGRSLLELVSAEGVRRGHDLEAVAIGMATGLASVHQAGLVHGSFGPEFVIMAVDGSPRVVEFGITPPYGTATPSADMVAWARTVVFAASGRAPAARADLDVLPGHLRGPVEQCLDPQSAGPLSARTAVRSLLGSQDLPAGLLAEGSRRAARPGRGGYDQVRSGVRQPGQADARLPAEPPAGAPTAARRTNPPRGASRGTTGSGTTGSGATGSGGTAPSGASARDAPWPPATSRPATARLTASGADSASSGPGHAVPSRHAGSEADSARSGPGHAAPSRHAASDADSARSGPSHAVPSRHAGSEADSARSAAARAGRGHAGSVHAAPARAQAGPPALGTSGSRHSADSLPVRHARDGKRRRRRVAWLVGGGAAVIVVAAVLLHVLIGGGHAGSGLLSAKADKTRSSPSPPASVTPTIGPTTPAAFDGSWSGLVRQPPSDTYHVGVTLAAGMTAGTIRYSGPGFTCSGVLTLTRASSRELTMRQGITGRSSCEDGEVTIKLAAPNKITISFRSTGPIASGSLARSSA